MKFIVFCFLVFVASNFAKSESATPTPFPLDPEAGLQTPGIIKRWGYPVEEHQALTKDGYILTIHRIPYGLHDGLSQNARRPVAFLQHGLEASSSNWISNLPTLSMGYLLADAGFDVWMGNVRGNLYSLNHTKYSVKSHEFWKFTWDEMQEFDLTAMIDTALTKTNHSSLYYVGHSQGTLIMFSKLAEDVAFASKIRKFFALAPVGTVKHIQGLLEVIAKDFYDGFEVLYKLFGEDQFLPDDAFMKAMLKIFCEDSAQEEQSCANMLFLISGPSTGQMNATRVPVFLSDEPGGTSTMNIIHWSQMVRTGKQQKYDYENGLDNLWHYGSVTPPEYNLANINADIHLYWSPCDWLADEQDITEHLLKNINPNSLKESVKLDDFSHTDFTWGSKAKDQVYLPIIATLKKDLAQNGDP
uniref:Lipase n=1 Tax=Panagrolaimus superbus TaxID=310955 RepID=A0A914Y8M4_9BILA